MGGRRGEAVGEGRMDEMERVELRASTWGVSVIRERSCRRRYSGQTRRRTDSPGMLDGLVYLIGLSMLPTLQTGPLLSSTTWLEVCEIGVIGLS